MGTLLERKYPPEADPHSKIMVKEHWDGLGVPEVWRYDYDAHQIVIHGMAAESRYEEVESSRLLPNLPVQSLAWFVRRGAQISTSRLLGEVRDRVRRGCPPPDPG